MKIPMMDLQVQYIDMKKEINIAVQKVMDSADYINGAEVSEFTKELAAKLDVPYVIPCANCTDALLIALMGLGLKPGDEVIVPAFAYVSAAEMIVLLGMTPIAVDVDPYTFNINTEQVEQTISSRTRAIVAIHLFGQCCDMEPIRQVASKYNLYIIEDNAQSLGAAYTFPDKTVKMGGTIGNIGVTSFFPTKPLGCYGDGGALMTSDPELAERVRLIANHGQSQKYYHKVIGCNSRLDTLQAAILRVKLRYMDAFTQARQEVAHRYDTAFRTCRNIAIPARAPHTTHIYHQYTLRVTGGSRNALQALLQKRGIACQVYYPLALQEQQAFKVLVRTTQVIREAVNLSRTVLSLPIYPEMEISEQDKVIAAILEYERSV